MSPRSAETEILSFFDGECVKLTVVFINNGGVVLLIKGEMVNLFAGRAIDIAFNTRVYCYLNIKTKEAIK